MKIYRFKNKMERCDACGSKVTLVNASKSSNFPLWGVICERCGNNVDFPYGWESANKTIEAWNKWARENTKQTKENNV